MLSAILLGLIPLGVPIIIILRAAFIRRRSKKGEKRSDAVIPPIETNYTSFHQAEFTAIKSEIAELVKASSANFQYAVLASGGIFTWIVTAGHAKDQAAL